MTNHDFPAAPFGCTSRSPTSNTAQPRCPTSRVAQPATPPPVPPAAPHIGG